MNFPAFVSYYGHIIVFFFGAIVGSFLNVCIVRIPNGDSLVRPRSHCLKCKTPIAIYDNVPIVSFLWLRGRCRACSEPISGRYVLVELLMALLAVALYHRAGFVFEFFIAFIFVAALIVISFVDLDVRIVPDVISLPGIVAGLLFSLLGYFLFDEALGTLPSPVSSLIGILTGGGFLLATAWLYEKVTGVEGMGGGDIKLLAMIGAFLGWPAIPVTLFVASLVGSIVGVATMVLTGAGRRLALPFAPFLCSAALIHVFFSREILQFYLPGY